MTDNFRVRRLGSGPLADCFEVDIEDSPHWGRESFYGIPPLMAPINYLPGLPISDRVFPCPRKYMLIYGHTPTPPPPATLTQEQLARDAGQLVQAHAALDKLVSDTDRNANSLLDRIEQIAEETEKVNKLLDSAGLNPKAGIVECVKTLKRRCDRHAKACDDPGVEMVKLYSKIEELKDRNKRLHAAQGSGNAAAAELANVRKRLLSSFPGKTYEEAKAAFAGHHVCGVVEELVEALKRQPKAIGDEILEAVTRAADLLRGVKPCFDTLQIDKAVGALITERLKSHAENAALSDQIQTAHRIMNEACVAIVGDVPLDNRVEALIAENKRLRQSVGVSETIQHAHRLLHDAGVEPRLGNIIERVRSLVEERDRLKNDAGYRPLYDMVQKAHRKLNDAGVISGPLDILQRVETLIEDRDRLQRLAGGDFTLQKHVIDAHILLDKAGIPNGQIDQRVRVAIERGQESKPKPWSVSLCSVMHADGNRRIHCTSRELAEQTCEILNRQEAR